MTAQETRRLRAQVERLLPRGKTLRDIAETGPAAGGARLRPRRFVDRRKLVRKLEEGLDLTANETFYLRSIILPERRPVIDVVEGSYADVEHEDWARLNDLEVKARMEAAIAAVGRVELVESGTVTPLGTGFLVGQNLLLTNRHVAYEFAVGTGTRFIGLHSENACVNFGREIGNPDDTTRSFRIVSVVMMHPYWDIALLKIEGMPPGVAPLALASDATAAGSGKAGAVIGYPGRDKSEPEDVQNEIMRNAFEVKRLQPGFLGDPIVVENPAARGIKYLKKGARCLTHDSSTLAGSSGSPVVSFDTGEVVGVHFWGDPPVANWAIVAADMACDQHIIDAGVGFTGVATVSSAEPWDTVWGIVEPA